MPKKVDMTYFKVLSQHLLGRADRNDEKLNLQAVMVLAVNKELNIQSKTSYYDNIRKTVGCFAKCIRNRGFFIKR
jgi:hypothetical protein